MLPQMSPTFTHLVRTILVATLAGSGFVGCVAPPEATKKIKDASLVKAAANGLDVKRLQSYVNDRSAVILAGVDIEGVERVSSDTVAVQLDTKDGESIEVSFGLGAAVSNDGYYVTAAHTVQENNKNDDQIWLVRNVEARPYVRARVVWSDPKADLAIVKGNLRTSYFNQSDSLPSVGNRVFCHGKDAWPSAGEVKRLVFDQRRKTYTIEHNAPLKRGDSGGAAVNAAGQLVGVNTEITWEGSTAVVAPPLLVQKIIAEDRKRNR